VKTEVDEFVYTLVIKYGVTSCKATDSELVNALDLLEAHLSSILKLADLN